MSFYWKIPVEITVRTPWVIPGDAAPGPAVDIVLARNAEGRFILPGTLVKGNLWAAARVLVDEGHLAGATVFDAFGTPSGARRKGAPANPWIVANEPERGTLRFPDFVIADMPSEGGKMLRRRTARVEIDPELGAAKEGHLQFVECPFDYGKDVTFSGDVIWMPSHMPGATPVAVEEVQKLLTRAGKRVFALGGMKTAGFGRVSSFTVHLPQEGHQKVSHASAEQPETELLLTYSVDRPFIIDTARHSGNLSVSSDVLPGGAIKGTLAGALAAAGILDDEFLSNVTIGHAQPNGRRALPLSLSICADKAYCNLDGRLRPGHHKFQSDWKGDAEKRIRSALGEEWSAPEIRLSGRSRTKVDSDTLTSSYELGEDGKQGSGQLFGQVAVVPTRNLVWTGKLIAPKTGKALDDIVAILEMGVPGFGKTGAVISARPTQLDRSSMPPDQVDLCLETEACLFSPEAAKGASVRALYQAYFGDLGFELVNFFAQQTLKGGYLALRYPASGAGYIPWVMTAPGSVFRLKPKSDADLSDILVRGLPPAKGVSRDWRKVPFLPENGYGQVSCDFDHATLAKGVELK